MAVRPKRCRRRSRSSCPRRLVDCWRSAPRFAGITADPPIAMPIVQEPVGPNASMPAVVVRERLADAQGTR